MIVFPEILIWAQKIGIHLLNNDVFGIDGQTLQDHILGTLWATEAYYTLFYLY